MTVTEEKRKSYTEVLEILKYVNEKDVAKIPKQFIQVLENNKSTVYSYEVDKTKGFKEQNLSKSALNLIAYICRNYWSDDKGRIEFDKKLLENDKKYEKIQREKYNPDNIFKKDLNINVTDDENKQNNSIAIINNDNIFIKIINKIKSIFKIK